MKPSFFYLVPKGDAARLAHDLVLLGVPFCVEQRGEQVAFVFPDLPVRVYAQVRQLFGGDGLPYLD